MLTLRPIEKGGKWGQKSRTENGRKIPTVNWNDKDRAEVWRQAWGGICNEYLSKNNIEERIDHRSFKRQGKEEIPTVHLGVAACQMERKGIQTEKGNKNRAAAVTNSELRQLKARIRKAKEWLYSQPIQNAPTMVSIFNSISNGKNLTTQWQKVNDLKTRANVFNFLQDNGITDIGQLADKVEKINNEYYDVLKKIKATDRRLETLVKHIEQAENLKKYKPIFDKYNSIEKGLSDKLFNRDPKADFYEKNMKAINLFESADRYLKDHLNGKVSKPPLKKWKAEYEELTAERFLLCDKYYSLKDEIKNVKILRHGVESLMRENEIEKT
jgi:hypothetical protein